MHEVAVMERVVESLLVSMEHAGATHVTNIQWELGTSEHFSEEVVRQYFQALTRDTPLGGATVTLRWLPATCQCLSCQHRFESSASMGICPHYDDVALEVSHQHGCYISAIDMVSSNH